MSRQTGIAILEAAAGGGDIARRPADRVPRQQQDDEVLHDGSASWIIVPENRTAIGGAISGKARRELQCKP